MDRALEDIGWPLQKAIAILVATLGHSGPQSANLVVANQPKDGIRFLVAMRQNI
jgi:hypothetical protein